MAGPGEHTVSSVLTEIVFQTVFCVPGVVGVTRPWICWCGVDRFVATCRQISAGLVGGQVVTAGCRRMAAVSPFVLGTAK